MSDRRKHNERIAADALGRLPVAKAPDSIWRSIEAGLDEPVRGAERSWHPMWVRWAYAAVAVLIMAGAGFYWRSTHQIRWEVIRTVGSQELTETIGVGERLQTDSKSTAEMRVGAIGTVKISPGTSLRVVTTKSSDHRLSLEHGEIAASIYAPPKLFFVETKSGTAVDLGCQYKMKVDQAGNGLLTVTLGWVAFDWQGRESLVPAGASCHTRAGAGPGTPLFTDAPAGLAAALEEFDFSGGSETALRRIVDSTRPRDTLTLWHLLSRVREPLRLLVYDRMVSFATPPAGVNRDKALELDPQTLKLWKDELVWTW